MYSHVRSGNQKSVRNLNRRRSSTASAELSSPLSNRRGSVQGDGRSTGSGSPMGNRGNRGRWNDGAGSNEVFYQLAPNDNTFNALNANNSLKPTIRWELFALKMIENDWNALNRRIRQIIPQDVVEIFNKAESDEK
jgi:hypothetical protein